jgi:hypothetical protein
MAPPFLFHCAIEQATKTKKPLTTETQRHREKHENPLFFKDFLCVSVSLWLMVLGFLHRIHPSGESIMLGKFLFFFVFSVFVIVN